MYLVTGGAGFIGSNIVASLSEAAQEVAVCDWMRSDERWRNLAKHTIAALIVPPDLPAWLTAHRDSVSAVIHMGANSNTAETNIEDLADNNIRTTLSLFEWCTDHQVPLLYASSAATYGEGRAGFDDVFTTSALAALRPLNAYGWSKHVVDKRVAQRVESGARMPPQWVGLKFFNVYGPNEYHKGAMQSVIAANVRKLTAGDSMRLFRSYREDFADGAQVRDFIYVKDCVDIVLWFLKNPSISGLYNVGTGESRSWRDLALAMFSSLKRSPSIEFIDMPSHLVAKYQYVTQAQMARLRHAGYDKPFTALEAGVDEYIRGYLLRDDPYR